MRQAHPARVPQGFTSWASGLQSEQDRTVTSLFAFRKGLHLGLLARLGLLSLLRLLGLLA